MAREYTNFLYDLVDEGIVDKDMVISMCLGHMSEYEVRDMCLRNEIDKEDF